MFFLDYFLKGLRPQFDDDSCDRINYYFTPVLLTIFSLTLSAKQYVGQPIQCWISAQYTYAWEQYIENYCFVESTYFVRPDAHFPDSAADRESQKLGYYQWVPFVLGLQAILFYMPSLVWRLLNWHSGIAVKSIIQMARDTANMQAERRKESVNVVAAHIHDSLRFQRKLQAFTSVTSISHKGAYLTSLYLVVKVLYLLQVTMQFVILNNFLSTSYTFWGFGILRDLLHGREWEESGHFPRVTICDFEIRVLDQKHRHTVQCVLMINMFNEKVYLFLWFWMFGVAIYTFVSLIYWASQMLIASRRRNFIATYIKVFGLIKQDDISSEHMLSTFVSRGLRHDGVFLLHLLSKNAGDIITTELTTKLWRRFLEDEKQGSIGSPRGPALDDIGN